MADYSLIPLVGTRFSQIVPSNTVNFTPANRPRAIYFETAGDVALVGDDDVVVTITAVPLGAIFYISPKRINLTGTTAEMIGFIPGP